MRTTLALMLLFALPLLAVEDPKLREQANNLAERSVVVTSPVHWPPHRHDVKFQYTASDGTTTEGTLAVER